MFEGEKALFHLLFVSSLSLSLLSLSLSLLFSLSVFGTYARIALALRCVLSMLEVHVSMTKQESNEEKGRKRREERQIEIFPYRDFKEREINERETERKREKKNIKR